MAGNNAIHNRQTNRTSLQDTTSIQGSHSSQTHESGIPNEISVISDRSANKPRAGQNTTTDPRDANPSTSSLDSIETDSTTSSVQRKSLLGATISTIYKGLTSKGGIAALSLTAGAIGMAIYENSKAVGNWISNSWGEITSFASETTGQAVFGNIGFGVIGAAAMYLFSRANANVEALNKLAAVTNALELAGKELGPSTKEELKNYGLNSKDIKRLESLGFLKKSKQGEGENEVVTYKLKNKEGIEPQRRKSNRNQKMLAGVAVLAATGAGILNGALFANPTMAAVGGTLGFVISAGAVILKLKAAATATHKVQAKVLAGVVSQQQQQGNGDGSAALGSTSRNGPHTTPVSEDASNTSNYGPLIHGNGDADYLSDSDIDSDKTETVDNRTAAETNRSSPNKQG